MIRNFKYAIRSLYRDRFFSVINITGLSLAFTASAFIFIWVYHELTYDSWHHKEDRIYRVLTEWNFGGEKELIENTAAPVAVGAVMDIPEIENATRIFELWSPLVRRGTQKFDAEHTLAVDGSFFNIFDFELVAGNMPAEWQPSDIILSESQAIKVFGSTDVVGEILELSDGEDFFDYEVTAIIEDPPSNSSLSYGMLLSFEESIERFGSGHAESWGQMNYTTYVLTTTERDHSLLEQKLNSIIPKELRKDFGLFIQPLSEIHLHSDHISYSTGNYGNLSSIKMIILIALLIIFIACINYINLTTARINERIRSIGIFKLVGADRKHLFAKFIIEALLIVLVSVGIGVLLILSSLDFFETFTGISVLMEDLYNSTMVLIMTGIILLLLLVAGIQPAWLLSKFKPLDAIQGKNTIVRNTAGRKILVGIQFIASTILIIATSLIILQKKYTREYAVGYDKENIVAFTAENPETIVRKLKNDPKVLDITTSSHDIVNVQQRRGGFDYEGKAEGEEQYMWATSADASFLSFFGLQMVSGRWFREGRIDSNAIILNESAVKMLGWDEPLGKQFDMGTSATVVGVVKDFHFRSLHHPVEQLAFYQAPRWHNRVYIKALQQDFQEVITKAEALFNTMNPAEIFQYEFLDEQYNSLYADEARHSKIISAFAIIAIIISCLGVFGLTTYSTQKRKKEIGIRKVLGSSISEIIALITKDYIWTLLTSLIISIPASIYLMQKWLHRFAYHIDISWWVISLCVMTTLFITFATSGVQSLRAALENPVDAIRPE